MKKQSTASPRGSLPCPAKAGLKERPLMTPGQAAEVEALFKVLANDTRLRLLHEIVRQREACVGDLASAVEMKPQAVSNQLQRLHDQGIVASRREGNHIYYRLADHCITILLERGLCLIEEAGRRRHPPFAETPRPSATNGQSRRRERKPR